MQGQATAQQMADRELLVQVATAANRFRSAVINGDTKWVHKRTETAGSQASRDLCELLVECYQRDIL